MIILSSVAVCSTYVCFSIRRHIRAAGPQLHMFLLISGPRAGYLAPGLRGDHPQPALQPRHPPARVHTCSLLPRVRLPLHLQEYKAIYVLDSLLNRLSCVLCWIGVNWYQALLSNLRAEPPDSILGKVKTDCQCHHQSLISLFKTGSIKSLPSTVAGARDSLKSKESETKSGKSNMKASLRRQVQDRKDFREK